MPKTLDEFSEEPKQKISIDKVFIHFEQIDTRLSAFKNKLLYYKSFIAEREESLGKLDTNITTTSSEFEKDYKKNIDYFTDIPKTKEKFESLAATLVKLNKIHADFKNTIAEVRRENKSLFSEFEAILLLIHSASTEELSKLEELKAENSRLYAENENLLLQCQKEASITEAKVKAELLRGYAEKAVA